MLIYFPNMIPANWTAEEVDSALFFDPGLDAEQNPGTYRPDDLPLDPDKAKHALGDMLGFGEQFRDASELATYKTELGSKKQSETTGSIRNQLLKRLGGSSGKPKGTDHLLSAQITLLLAYSMDQRISELKDLDKGVGATWDRFDGSLGTDADDVDPETKKLSRAVADLNAPESSERLPWKTVLTAMSAFLPTGATLLVADKDAFDFWNEHDMLSEQKVEDRFKKLFGPVVGTREKVWKLSGFTRLPAGQDWLDKEISIIILGC